MRHLECTDILSVILDPIQRVSQGGIVVDEDSAILENKKQRYATVLAAPEFYTITRATGHNTIKHIRTRSPVKAGDRVLVDRFAGVTSVKDGDKTIHLIRFDEIIGIVDEEENDDPAAQA